MKILLQAFDDATETATCAVVEVDVDQVLRRKELLLSVQLKDNELVKLSFWDSISFFSVDYDEALDEETAAHLDKEQWAVLPQCTNEEKWESDPVTDYGMMVLRHNTVGWQAYPKHGPPGILTTANITYEVIEGLKELRNMVEANEEKMVKAKRKW
jgi:hypothetical protein